MGKGTGLGQRAKQIGRGVARLLRDVPLPLGQYRGLTVEVESYPWYEYHCGQERIVGYDHEASRESYARALTEALRCRLPGAGVEVRALAELGADRVILRADDDDLYAQLGIDARAIEQDVLATAWEIRRDARWEVPGDPVRVTDFREWSVVVWYNLSEVAARLGGDRARLAAFRMAYPGAVEEAIRSTYPGLARLVVADLEGEPHIQGLLQIDVRQPQYGHIAPGTAEAFQARILGRALAVLEDLCAVGSD